MNRRTFLASLAATSLTPIMPNQIFASGGILNPEHCGFTITGNSWVGKSPGHIKRDLDIMINILMYGDGTDRKSGLFAS